MAAAFLDLVSGLFGVERKVKETCHWSVALEELMNSRVISEG